MQRFPEKLRALRHWHGMSQRKLANAMGVGPSFIYKLETGQKKPNIEFGLRLAKLLGVTLDQLFDDEVELPLPDSDDTTTE